MSVNPPVLGPYYKLHLDLLAANTDFLSQWSRLGVHNQKLYSAALYAIEDLCGRYRQSGAMRDAHNLASSRLCSCLDVIHEKPFPEPPNLNAWLRYGDDPNAVARAFDESWERLESFFLKSGAGYVMRWNSIKSSQRMAGKIQLFRQHRVELDLWDTVRFRASVACPHALRALCQQLLDYFGGQVCRLRNYYSVSRNGENDSYRAIHFEILAGETFFELQINTVARDLIGLLDHDLTATKRVPFLDDTHRLWLEDLRMAANVYDSSLL